MIRKLTYLSRTILIESCGKPTYIATNRTTSPHDTQLWLFDETMLNSAVHNYLNTWRRLHSSMTLLIEENPTTNNIDGRHCWVLKKLGSYRSWADWKQRGMTPLMMITYWNKAWRLERWKCWCRPPLEGNKEANVAVETMIEIDNKKNEKVRVLIWVFLSWCLWYHVKYPTIFKR